MTATRRKYRYASREAAETAASYNGIERDRLSSAIQGMMNGKVKWLPKTYGVPAAYYRFGVIHRRFESLALVMFCAPATGQDDHTAVYSEDWLAEEIQSWAYTTPSDDEQRKYREGLYDLRAFINDTRPE